MWLIPTKKELNKELENIRKGFKERDDKIEKLKEKVDNNSLKIATLEGSYLILLNKSQVSVSTPLKQSQDSFETKLARKIRNNKKSLIMKEIIELTPSHTAQERFNIIVNERRLCSKASFYRYLASLKSQKLIETETELRLKNDG